MGGTQTCSVWLHLWFTQFENSSSYKPETFYRLNVLVHTVIIELYTTSLRRLFTSNSIPLASKCPQLKLYLYIFYKLWLLVMVWRVSAVLCILYLEENILLSFVNCNLFSGLEMSWQCWEQTRKWACRHHPSHNLTDSLLTNFLT